MMNRIVFFFVCIICSTVVVAQKTYFLYLQSDSKQIFFVKHQDEILNSTSSGYLIIPELRDSSYLINIGIQGKELNNPFFININKKDQGYLIMNEKDKGLNLFDLQSLALVKPFIPENSKDRTEVKTEKMDSNPFNNMLSKAIDDSSIKEKLIFVKKEEKKPEPAVLDSITTMSQSVAEITKEKKTEIEKKEIVIEEINKRDSVVVTLKEEFDIKKSEKLVIKEKVEEKLEVVPVIEKEIEENKIKQEKSTVRYNSESSTTEGVGLVFTDSFKNGNTDTIRILIPNEQITKAIVVESAKKEMKFLDIDTNPKKENTVIQPEKVEVIEKKEDKLPIKETIINQVKEIEKKELVSVNAKNNCINFATETDFFDVRKIMANEKDDDGMIDQAKKYFKAKCFTTAQIKNLGSLFLYDLGRYQFYNASNGFVSDKDNFSSLESEFKDEYFMNRFRSMLKNK